MTIKTPSMLKWNSHSVKWWVAAAAILIVMAIGIPISLTLAYAAQNRAQITESQQHACEALGLILAIPAPKPVNPTANPSRESNYKFHVAIAHWYDANNCTPASASK
jgi:hypothetical protein